MLKIGLTGSLAMGKTTTAQIFMEHGIPVHDSDLCVHNLYKKEAVDLIARIDPVLVQANVVDRKAITEWISKDPSFLSRLEAVVHPLVNQKRSEFLKDASQKGAPIVVLDVPLLFETGQSKKVDLIVVVTTDEHIQKARALNRPGMTVEKYNLLLSRQFSNLEKIKRAHWVLDTSFGLDRAKADVKTFIDALAI